MASAFSTSSILLGCFRSQAPSCGESAAQLAAVRCSPQKALPSGSELLLEANRSPEDYFCKENDLQLKHSAHLRKVRDLFYMAKSPSDSIFLIDSLQKLGIDYHFTEEIKDCLQTLNDAYYKTSSSGENINLLREAPLLFRLLRQARFPVSSDVFGDFLNRKGELKVSVQRDVRSMLHLYEASFLNMGDEVLLYKANELCSKELRSSMPHLNASLCWQVGEALDHPRHWTTQRYKAWRYLNHHHHHHRRGDQTSDNTYLIEELARIDQFLIQSLHRNELQEFKSWWRNVSSAMEPNFTRDRSLKWYAWSVAACSDPKLSKCRNEITKVISFVYLIDDIFDVYGSPDELTLFTDAITKWDLSAAASLPSYMRDVYAALHKTIDEIAKLVLEEHGCNPMNSLKQSWIDLCNAFMLEAKWFHNKLVPASDDYLRNGIVSTGVHIVLWHLYFLLGDVQNNMFANVTGSSLKVASNSVARILRLTDDLYAEDDGEQEGLDGSYLRCFMRENPDCSRESAKEHGVLLIRKAWEELNWECLSSSSLLSEFFSATCLNSAKMVKVMYTYAGKEKLLIFNDYLNSIFGSL